MRANVALGLYLLSLAIAGCSPSATDVGIEQSDCQRVRAHQADLRAAAIVMSDNVDSARAAAERAKHRANFIKAGGQDYLDRCANERSEAWVECSLAAATLEAMRRCSE